MSYVSFKFYANIYYWAKIIKILGNEIRGNSLGKLIAKIENTVYVIPEIWIGNS